MKNNSQTLNNFNSRFSIIDCQENVDQLSINQLKTTGKQKTQNRLITGFSLIELIIYLAIFSILLLVFTQIFTWIINIQQESNSTSSIYQDAEFISNRLNYDIKRANNIIFPLNPGEQSNNLQLLIDGINYTYRVEDENLILINDLGINHLMNSFGTTVSGLNVKKIGNINGKSTINLSFVLTSRIKQGGLGFRTKSFQMTIGTR